MPGFVISEQTLENQGVGVGASAADPGAEAAGAFEAAGFEQGDGGGVVDGYDCGELMHA